MQIVTLSKQKLWLGDRCYVKRELLGGIERGETHNGVAEDEKMLRNSTRMLFVENMEVEHRMMVTWGWDDWVTGGVTITQDEEIFKVTTIAPIIFKSGKSAEERRLQG